MTFCPFWERQSCTKKYDELKLVNLMKKNEILFIENFIYLSIRLETFGWIYIYIYIIDLNLALDNLQGLICNKTQPTNQPIFKSKLFMTNYGTWLIGLVGRVFVNGLGDLCSIPGPVIPKTMKMVLDTSLLKFQQYKVHIKGKAEQSRERSRTLPYTSV